MQKQSQIYDKNDEESPLKISEKIRIFQDTKIITGVLIMSLENENMAERFSVENTACKQRYLELEELLEFAAEEGKLQPIQIAGEDGSLQTVSLADEVKSLKSIFFYGKPLTLDELIKAEARLEKIYAAVSALISPVRIDTLRTTSGKEKDFVKRSSRWAALFLGENSRGNNFFRQTLWMTAFLILILIINSIFRGLGFDSKLQQILNAFTLGAIGAIVFLYKNLTTFHVNRTLDPDKLSTDWLRVFMGALSGGLMALLFKDAGQENAGQFGLGAGAVGFLAGYSVEYFYRTLDRIIDALVPGKGESSSKPAPSQEQLQQEALIELLNRTTDADDKATIRKLLEKSSG